MPTELTDATGDRLRERGREYGTTTGRPRRCGWFDGLVARHAAEVNGLDSIALTLLDVLDDLDPVRVCTGYRHGDRTLDRLPLESWKLSEVEPIYEDLPGWRESTRDVRRFEDLPAAARDYIARIEKVAGCEVGLVSVGPARDQSIRRGGSRLGELLPELAANAGS